MTALRHADNPAPIAVRKTHWLPALEKALRSRVGWVDEAVSPFAAKRRMGRAEPKIQRDGLRAETTPQAA
jgi:hypothetical protein